MTRYILFFVSIAISTMIFAGGIGDLTTTTKLLTANFTPEVDPIPIIPPTGFPFPTIRIETGTTAVDANGHNPFGITRDEWRTAVEGTYISIENAWDESLNFANIPTDIRGRGNSTWWDYQGRKQPYRIRYPNPATNHRSMLDSGYIARNWSFLANQCDNTLSRNYAAHELGRLLDTFCFAPFVRNVHLYMNGDYRGVYLLVDHMDNDGRVDINWDRNNPDQSEYYIEMCRRQAGDFRFVVADMPFEFREDSGATTAHVEVARVFVQSVHDAIYDRNWVQIQNLIDLPSWVDFYIVNELFKQIDINYSSIHMTIRGVGENRRLHKGPLWDFDRSSGAHHFWFDEGISFYIPWTLGAWISAKDVPFIFSHFPCPPSCAIKPSIIQRSVWYSYLFDIPEFRAMVRERFDDVKHNHITAMIDFVETMGQTHNSEFWRNYDRWEMVPNTFLNHLTVQIEYYNARVLWMEELLSE
jgi:hypothetical protein